MFDRLLHVIREEIDVTKDVLLSGKANDFMSYRSEVTKVLTLQWVIGQIDKLNHEEEFVDEGLGSDFDASGIEVE